MARKNAKHCFNNVQSKCQKDAKKIVAKWFSDNTFPISKNDIYIVWFALVPQGYRCMVGTNFNDNLFFDINKNMKTGSLVLQCFRRFEYLVKPNDTSSIEMHGIQKEFY